MYIVLTLIFAADTLPRMTSEPSVSAKPDSYQVRHNSRGSHENVRHDSHGQRSDSIGRRRQSREKRKSLDIEEPEKKHEIMETDISTFVSKNYNDEPKVIPIKVQVEETAPKQVVIERPSTLDNIGKQDNVEKVEENHIEAQVIKSVESSRPKLKELARYSSKDFTRTVEVMERQTVLEAEPVVVARTTVVETKLTTEPGEVDTHIGMNGLPHKGSRDHGMIKPKQTHLTYAPEQRFYLLIIY